MNQLNEEGIVGIPFEYILIECVFCGNAMVTVGGSTPYNALHGRAHESNLVLIKSIFQMKAAVQTLGLSPMHTACDKLVSKLWWRVRHVHA